MKSQKEQILQNKCQAIAREIWELSPAHQCDKTWEEHLWLLISIGHETMLKNIHSELKAMRRNCR